MKNRIVGMCGIGILTISTLACSEAPSPAAPSPAAADVAVAGASLEVKPDFAAAAKPGTMTIVGIVLQPDDEFDVLQAAVVRAGLVDTLNGGGQFTVFAPTDLAFVTTLGVADEAAAIAAVNALSTEALTNILLYHVTEGRRNSNSVLAAPRYTMLNGGTLSRETLAAAGIAKTDISASNGIVHVINAVLLP